MRQLQEIGYGELLMHPGENPERALDQLQGVVDANFANSSKPSVRRA